MTRWSITYGLLLFAGVAFGSAGCDGRASVTGSENPAAANHKLEGAGSGRRNAAEDARRAWIVSLTLKPSLPNKDESVTALMKWEPQGRPGTLVSYEWRVNDVPVMTGEAGTLALRGYHTGDHVSVVVTIADSKGTPLASQRSLSVVIQNRPPTLNGGLEGFELRGDEWVGHVSMSDPDGDTVIARLIQAPAGMTMEPDGTVHWPVSAIQSGMHELTVEVEDERGLGFRGSFSFSMKDT